MLLNMVKSLSFIRLAVQELILGSTRMSQPEKVTSNGLPPTIKTVSMTAFLDFLCEEIPGVIAIEQWMEILNDYQVLRGDTVDMVEQLRLSKEIKRLNFHLFLVGKCIQVLSERYSESVVNSLKELGYRFNPESKIPSEYIKELNRVVAESKLKYVMQQQAVKQLQEHITKNPYSKPKRETFEGSLADIEQYQHVTYSFDTLSVYRFVILEKKMVAYYNKLNAKNGRRAN